MICQLTNKNALFSWHADRSYLLHKHMLYLMTWAHIRVYNWHQLVLVCHGLCFCCSVQAIQICCCLLFVSAGANVESMAQDYATILFEASASGNPEIISLLLEYGADANVPKHTGHLPIHRVSHRGHLQ